MNFVDDIFEEFACAFIGRVKGAGEIAEKRKLNRKRLDFSVDSLHVVDDYLLVLHERHDQGKLDAKGDQLAVLRGGAYLGEVIRRNSDEQWHWVDYDEYMPSHPAPSHDDAEDRRDVRLSPSSRRLDDHAAEPHQPSPRGRSAHEHARLRRAAGPIALAVLTHFS